MMKGEFTLEMFLNSQRMMKKMGSIGDIMKMMGLGGMLNLNSEQQAEIANFGENMMKLYESAINSMTPEERQKPQIIDMSRRRRIARGSNLKVEQVGQMLNEFEQMRQMWTQFSTMLGGFGGMPGLPGMGGFPGMGAGDPGNPKTGSQAGFGDLPGVMKPGALPPGFPNMPGRGLPPNFPPNRPAGPGFRKKGKKY
jgi:signal recognition particle subunit SRP54